MVITNTVKKVDRPVAILVIRSSAMGDVAMSAPVLAAFRKKYKGVSIVMLTRGFYAPFFDGIDGFEIFNVDLAGRHHGIPGTWKLYRDLIQGYDFKVIVDLNDKLYSRLLRKFFLVFSFVKSYDIDKGRAEKKALTRAENKKSVQLKTSIQRYCDAFTSASYPVEVENVLPKRDANRKFPIPMLELSAQHRSRASLVEQGLRYIGVAPFAQHKGKRIPIETINNLITLIGERLPEVHIFIFGGGDVEREVAVQLEVAFGNVTSAIGVLTLRQEMDLMSNVELMVSMDSSSMHLSSLVGTPVVSVWGATHPFAGFLGMGQDIENVVQVAELDCRPCSIYGHKPCRRVDYACLTLITAEDIYSKVERLIQKADL